MKLNEINDDCLENIFSFLDINQKLAILRVCQRWRLLILGQFARERSLLITSLSDPTVCPPVPYLVGCPTNDELSSLHLPNANDGVQPDAQLFNFRQTADRDHYSPLVLSISNKLSLYQFDRVIHKFPNLNSIAFYSRKSCQTISVYVLRIVLEHCKGLTTINLADCKEVTSECLRVIADCRTLEHLDLSNCKNIGNNGLKLIFKNCKNLQSLYIGNNRRLTGQFFRCCTARIRNLDLTNATFTVKGLDALAACLGDSLESLVSFPILASDSLRYFCKSFPNLHRLKLTVVGEVDLGILADATLPELQSLSLNGRVELQDELFSQLTANFRQIEEFELCPNMPPKIFLSALDLPKRWPNLAKLSLNNLVLTSDKNRSLLRCFLDFRALDSLCIGLTDLEENDFAQFLAQLIQRQPKLRYLNVEYLLREPKDRLVNVEDQLKFVVDAGFHLHINQVRMNRHPPYLYLTKVAIRRP